jgi:uncharacterized protein YjiS (DUF1127 family)
MKPNHLELNSGYALLPFQVFPAPLRKFSRLSLALYWRQYQARKQLSHLSDERLRDVGLSREQVQIEVARPFWR